MTTVKYSHCILVLYFHPISSVIYVIDVVLEFQNPAFSTIEGTAANVCVVIQAGMIARPVSFSVTPSDGTATGIKSSV